MQISAHRGSLTDRYGEPLAVSTPVDTIYANPQELKPALDRLGELAAALEQDEEWLARRITSNLEREFVFLERHVSPAKAQQVLDLGLPGVGTVREYRRYYPAGEVTGHVVGFTDIDDRGQEGLEAAFDHWLKGEHGSKRVLQDRRGQVISDVELLQAARPGRDLRTSIDLRLAVSRVPRAQGRRGRQSRALGLRRRARSAHRRSARDGQPAVVQPERPRRSTGPRTTATARSPTCSSRARASSRSCMAAALESGDFSPRSVIDTSPAIVDQRPHHHEDPSNLGRIDLTTVLAKSSNVGAARVALTMEPQAISRRADAASASAGSPTAPFPASRPGVLNDPKHWRTIGQATLSYGYGVAVTTLQLARAYAAIAADGVLRPVSLLALDEAPAGERVISADTAADLTHDARSRRLAGGHGPARGRSQLSRCGQDRHDAEGRRRRLRRRAARRDLRAASRRRPSRASSSSS